MRNAPRLLASRSRKRTSSRRDDGALVSSAPCAAAAGLLGVSPLAAASSPQKYRAVVPASEKRATHAMLVAC
eukprot:scaffold79504_cov27-Tisochrysis_lutea.AAC.4